MGDEHSKDLIQQRKSLWAFFWWRESLALILLLLLGIFLGCFAYKVYMMKRQAEYDNKTINELESNIKIIEFGGSEFLISSLRDKTDRIHFFENPLKNQKGQKAIAYLDQLQREHDKLENLTKFTKRDINVLEEKHKTYENEIERVLKEFGVKKAERMGTQAGDDPIYEYY